MNLVHSLPRKYPYFCIACYTKITHCTINLSKSNTFLCTFQNHREYSVVNGIVYSNVLSLQNGFSDEETKEWDLHHTRGDILGGNCYA